MRPIGWRNIVLSSVILTAISLAMAYDSYRPTLSDFGAEVTGLGAPCACECPCQRDAGADGPLAVSFR